MHHDRLQLEAASLNEQPPPSLCHIASNLHPRSAILNAFPSLMLYRPQAFAVLLESASTPASLQVAILLLHKQSSPLLHLQKPPVKNPQPPSHTLLQLPVEGDASSLVSSMLRFQSPRFSVMPCALPLAALVISSLLFRFTAPTSCSAPAHWQKLWLTPTQRCYID